MYQLKSTQHVSFGVVGLPANATVSLIICCAVQNSTGRYEDRKSSNLITQTVTSIHMMTRCQKSFLNFSSKPPKQGKTSPIITIVLKILRNYSFKIYTNQNTIITFYKT